MKTPWSKAEIEALLARETYSYQRIELPHGLVTPGKERASSASLIFPADLTGKTILDLGCNHGALCFEAVKRGAARVVGLDNSPDIIRRARLLADAMGVSVEFEVRDLNARPVDEAFDYVLCLNLLHHLDDPLLQLETMRKAARERLVIEAAGLSLLDYLRRLDVVPLYAFLLSVFPVIFVARTPARKKVPAKLKYYFTRGALKRILGHREGFFKAIRTISSPHKGRFLLIADKS